MRYDPADRRKLVIDVPALHERELETWTKARDADRARAEAVLAAQQPAVEASAEDPGGLISPHSTGPQEDREIADLEALEKLDDLHRSGAISDDEFAAAVKRLGER